MRSTLRRSAVAVLALSTFACKPRPIPEVFCVEGEVDKAKGTATITTIHRRWAFQLPAAQRTDYALRLLDDRGAALRTDPLWVTETEPDIGDAIHTKFGRCVPLDARYHSAEVLLGEKVLSTRTASEHAPSVKVLPLRGEDFQGDRFVVRFEGNDEDGDLLSFHVTSLRDGVPEGEWESTGPRLEVPLDGYDVPRDVLVSVSDGFRTASDQRTFRLPHQPPRVVIRCPKVVTHESSLGCDAIAYETTGGSQRSLHRDISWSSSLDGTLGTGPGLVINASKLAIGRHAIRASVKDSSGVVGTSPAASLMVYATAEDIPEAVQYELSHGMSPSEPCKLTAPPPGKEATERAMPTLLSFLAHENDPSPCFARFKAGPQKPDLHLLLTMSPEGNVERACLNDPKLDHSPLGNCLAETVHAAGGTSYQGRSFSLELPFQWPSGQLQLPALERSARDLQGGE